MGGLAQLRVRVLGGLSVEGLDERRIGSRKGRTLLKVLALARGAPVTPERLADVLWPDELPSRPVDQVGVLVSRLRAVLGADRLPRGDAGYSVRLDWLDLVELETRVGEAERRYRAGQAAGARAAADAALTLVRGPLLPDEEGDWVDLERAAVEASVRRARLVLAEAALAGGEQGTAVAAAEALLAADPYDERALQALMRAHVAAGRPASALAAYGRVRERLGEDLGVVPTAETETLHDAIVLGGPAGEREGDAYGAGSPPPGPAAGRTSPASPPALVGREAELAAIAAELASVAGGGTALVVVEGEPGIGKTAVLGAASALAVASGYTAVDCDAAAPGRVLPLQPLLDGLAAALRARGPESSAAALGPDAETLEPLLGWRIVAGVPATVLEDAEASRSLLFTALLRTFERLAAGAPLLVTVDDLQRADAATVEWARFAVRRGRRLAVLAACRTPAPPAVAGGRSIVLGPLDRTAAGSLVGADRAGELYERSGGNPLFLVELARSDETVPATIRDAVGGRLDTLGAATAGTVRTAAVIGPEVDLDLLARLLGRSVSSLIDDADLAVGADLLVERGASYAFGHDLVREALESDVSAARRAFLHREAARVLAGRPGSDPRTVAWHARRGGDAQLAADALQAAASRAAATYEHDEAERLLGEAVGMADGPGVRLARARVRLARWDLPGAAEDAERALDLGGGPAALEVAGWIAYYGRDYDAAQRYADEGTERADDATLRASCLALAGRTRHSRGRLDEAEPRLVEAARSTVPEVRGVALVWLAGLRAHQGAAGEAVELAERALLEPHRLGHPFARFHAEFVRALALGMQGRPAALLSAVDAMEADAGRAGASGARFVPMALNLRAWALRAAGRRTEAAEALDRALDLCASGAAAVAEPLHVARIDMVELRLRAGDVDGARRLFGDVGPAVSGWDGTMAWRAKQRVELLGAMLALAAGDADGAEAAAASVASVAEAAGNARHALFARCVAAQAAAAGRRPVDLDAVDATLRALEPVAGLEAWLLTAELAARCGVDRWWADADRRAAALVASSGPLAGDTRRHVARSLERLRAGNR